MSAKALAELEPARRVFFPNDTPDQFLWRVCNRGASLPADKVEGTVFYLPSMCLGDPEHTHPARVIPESFGWKNTKYLFVLPEVDVMDVSLKQAASSQSRAGNILREELKELGFDLSQVMVTHALRFSRPTYLKSYTSGHKAVGADLVIQDIEGCHPDVIVVLGSDAFKSIYGAKAKISTYRGGVLSYTYADQSTAVVVPTASHLSFVKSTAEIEVFRADLKKALDIGTGAYVPRTVTRDYTVCRTLEEVEQLVARIAEDKPSRIAFDTEFGNDVAREEFTYTLTIQLAWGAGKAACILLRTQVQDPDRWLVRQVGKTRKKDGRGKLRTTRFTPPMRVGIPLHTPEVEQKIWKTVADLLRNPSWRLVAHHLRVDVEQFSRAGHPIDDRVEDGVDTMLIHHLLYGDESQGLDALVRKYVPEYGPYWAELEEWLDCKGSIPNPAGRKGALEYGYRNVPLPILIPYSLDDAASTWAIAEPLEKELGENERLHALYWKHVAPTSLHLLDVQRQGILVDDERRMQIRSHYLPAYEHFVARCRELLRWPEFNPASDDNIRSVLFAGTDYFNKKQAPPGVLLFNLTPLMNTDKYPRFWDQLIHAGEAHLHNPAVKAEVLDILHGKRPELEILILLKHISVLGKLLNDYLSPITINSYGVPEGGNGIHNNIWSDGRARTQLSQVTTTGRYTSKKANLQTMPKKQEAAILEAIIYYKFGISTSEYRRRTFDGKKDKQGVLVAPAYTGDDFIPPADRVDYIPYKTIFIARPGYSLVEIDFKNAELFGWAYVSGDPELIKIVNTGRDLHSEVACSAFDLPPRRQLTHVVAALEAGDPAPYKAWNDSFKQNYEAERIAAKTVNFG